MLNKSGVAIIDDSPADRALLKRAIRDACEGDVDVQVYETASEALKQIQQLIDDGRHSSANLLCLCDLKMPGMSGIEFVGEMKANTKLRPIPVTIISSSDVSQDVEAAYTAYASGYLVKPHGYAELAQKLQEWFTYWQYTVIRPLVIL